MTLIQTINQLADEIGLSEELRKVMEDFVDNYIGTDQEGYQNNNEYRENNIESIKLIFRVLKDRGKFAYFQKILRPYANKGADNLLSIIEEI